MPRVAPAKRVHANAVDNLLASTEVFPMTAPAPKGRLGNGQLRRHKHAARDRRPFSPRTGLPQAEATVGGDPGTWYEQARAYTEVKWASLAPASRPVAEALVTATVALTARSAARPRARCYGRRCSPGRSTPPLATGFGAARAARVLTRIARWSLGDWPGHRLRSTRPRSACARRDTSASKAIASYSCGTPGCRCSSTGTPAWLSVSA